MSLSDGSIESIIMGCREKPILPIMQVLGINEVTTNGNIRYHISLSDGRHWTSARLATEIHERANELAAFKIITILEYHTIIVKPAGQSAKRVLVISKIKETTNHNQVIGDPLKFIGPEIRCSPIRDVNRNMPVRAIRGQVHYKYGPRTYNVGCEEHRMFTATLLDEDGEIIAKTYHPNYNTFYDQIQTGQNYYIRDFDVRDKNRQYSNSSHSYEINLEVDTIIELWEGDIYTTPLKYRFDKIKKITVDPTKAYDVIGVSVEASGILGPNLTRDITLRDETGEILLTLWPPRAENYNIPLNQVFAIKSGKITSYMGELKIKSVTSIEINPDIPEAHELRNWYNCNR